MILSRPDHTRPCHSGARVHLRLLRSAAAATALLVGLSGQAQAKAPIQAGDSPELAYSLAAEASTARDYTGMLRLLRQSANGGYVPAQELLGVTLLNGPLLYGTAVPRDFCAAFKWFSRAAEAGSAVGRLHATLLHRTQRDKVRACP